ncbi:unnamed protein product [Gordionus sp. m RMFG-2023]
MVRPRINTTIENRPPASLIITSQAQGERQFEGSFLLTPNNSVDISPPDPNSQALISAMQAISAQMASLSTPDG